LKQIQKLVVEDGGYPKEKIFQIYDRIMAQQFKTDSLFIEKIYERIRAFSNEEITT